MLTITNAEGKALKFNIDNIATIAEVEKGSTINVVGAGAITVPETPVKIEELVKQARILRFQVPESQAPEVIGEIAPSENK